MLLNFNSSRRLLLTGTPLQNNLLELWSLMHFLMPNVFASHRDFKDWFVNPVTGMIEGNAEFNEEVVKRLHKILRPFLLRRLKKDVEKQLPQKHEHVIMCKLSKRQRFLYEEFMSQTKTKETLASGNFLSVINVLMQLRKVCNHPNLFETRPVKSPFAMERLFYESASLLLSPLIYDPMRQISFDSLNLNLVKNSTNLTAFSYSRIQTFKTSPSVFQSIDSLPEPGPRIPRGKIKLHINPRGSSTTSTLTKGSDTATQYSNKLSVPESGDNGVRSPEAKRRKLEESLVDYPLDPRSPSSCVTVEGLNQSSSSRSTANIRKLVLKSGEERQHLADLLLSPAGQTLELNNLRVPQSSTFDSAKAPSESSFQLF